MRHSLDVLDISEAKTLPFISNYWAIINAEREEEKNIYVFLNLHSVLFFSSTSRTQKKNKFVLFPLLLIDSSGGRDEIRSVHTIIHMSRTSVSRAIKEKKRV